MRIIRSEYNTSRDVKVVYVGIIDCVLFHRDFVIRTDGPSMALVDVQSLCGLCLSMPKTAQSKPRHVLEVAID